jgi:hypothetical protein
MSNSDQSDRESIEEDESVCVICGGTPCEWDEFGPELLRRQSLLARRSGSDEGGEDLVDRNGRPITYTKMRAFLYRTFTYMKFGHLGRGNRIPIPNCVVREIKKLYPDPEGYYTGFRDFIRECQERGAQYRQEQRDTRLRQRQEQPRQEEQHDEDDDEVEDEDEDSNNDNEEDEDYDDKEEDDDDEE